VAPPFRQAEFDIEYGVGISKEGGLLDMALEHDLIQKSGSFFSYGETRLGQGRNNTKEFLRDNPELGAEIEGKLYAKLGLGADGEAKPEADEAAPVKAVPEAKDEAERPDAKKPEAKKPEKKAA
jgi:recombination protein RecA